VILLFFCTVDREVSVIKLLAKTTRRPFQPAQVAAICYRRRRASIEFLLVNTSAGKWTFPKGRLDPRLSASEAAAREALEEAGAIGRIESSHFDSYLDTKRTFGDGYPSCEIHIAAYLLEVGSLAAPEEADRNPTWFSPEEAKKRLSEGRLPKYSNHLARIIDRAIGMVAGQNPGRQIAYQGQRRSAMVR
jgi:8-oxo-dGTP pyrophosphatase MutT (NUDIX family)